ncbi:GTPase family protein [Cryobacterium roopkundense]|uniref:GTPase SAR1 family protein n=1 Tax=Cryobacterium roopkundense TaxID=1001240 RepID=A0A7W9E4I3_9MICO|nr:GTPase domain-containing protein [Cryobacterium roopkundense]MBB5640975.1 GTPase SAR1 family protein [Cryobacterium roopkundense]
MTDNEWSDEDFHKKWQEQADQMGRFNLAIFGKTGVGKSTLINAIFGEDVAPTGVGEPVTMENHLYLHREGFLGLLDTRGLEIGKDTDTLIAELSTYVLRMRENPLSEQIHVAWYCVRATDRRFEDTERSSYVGYTSSGFQSWPFLPKCNRETASCTATQWHWPTTLPNSGCRSLVAARLW